MRAVQSLPSQYQTVGTLDLTKDERLLVILNLVGLAALVGFGWLFSRCIFWLRPQGTAGEFQILQINGWSGIITLIAAILGLTALHIVIHEAIHGVFFWFFTHSRPLFAFRWYYAYAAAPDWFIPRNPFLITTLAPLVLISLGGLVILRFAPGPWLLPTWFVMSMNAAGAVGDLLVAIWLLRQPVTCLAQDCGDAVTLFVPH